MAALCAHALLSGAVNLKDISGLDIKKPSCIMTINMQVKLCGLGLAVRHIFKKKNLNMNIAYHVARDL